MGASEEVKPILSLLSISIWELQPQLELMRTEMKKELMEEVEAAMEVTKMVATKMTTKMVTMITKKWKQSLLVMRAGYLRGAQLKKKYYQISRKHRFLLL